MKKIFTSEYIKALDRYTIEHEKVSEVELVERAGLAFVERFCRLFRPDTSQPIIFAGGGNNGADALAVALQLHLRGFRQKVFLIAGGKELSPTCRVLRRRVEEQSAIDFTIVEGEFEVPTLSPRSVIVDGLFGSGLNRPLEGGFLALVKFINESKQTVVSIDIPSGMFPDSNRFTRFKGVIKASYTFTFEFPKLAFLFAESEPYTGQVEVLDIGLSQAGKEQLPADYYLTTDHDIDSLLRARSRFSHKGTYGHALLVAGSRGKLGAALLAAQGALRSGVGKLTAFVPSGGEFVLHTALPEAMLITDDARDAFGLQLPLQQFDAIAIGPGLGQSEQAVQQLESLLARANKPLVLDADALNILAESRDLLNLLPQESILTPHPKEMERLTGYCATGEQRLEEAKLFAARYGVYVILKGAYTAICPPSGQVVFNPTGNPALASAGTGDVLTGIILSFLAQGYSPYVSAILATYLHGLAADYYAARYSPISMLASDVVAFLPEAFKAFGK